MFSRKRERERGMEGWREDGEGERGRALFPGVCAREGCFSLRPVVPRELTSAFNLMRAVCTACKPRYWHQGCACRRRPLQRQRLRGRRERAGRCPGQSVGPHRRQRHLRRRVAVATLPQLQARWRAASSRRAPDRPTVRVRPAPCLLSSVVLALFPCRRYVPPSRLSLPCPTHPPSPVLAVLALIRAPVPVPVPPYLSHRYRSGT